MLRRVNLTSSSSSSRWNTLEGLKSELDAVKAVIQTEDRRFGHAPSVLKAQPQLRPSQPPPQQAHTHQPLANFPIRQKSAVSAR